MVALTHELAKGPNGGPVVDSAGHHVEMVAKGTELVLFLTEADDTPLASAGAKTARAIVQDGGRTAAVPLRPAEPNKLVGPWPSRSDRVPAWSSRPPWRTATPSRPASSTTDLS
jgi:hypothetical protein